MTVYTQLDELTAAHDNIAAAIVAKGVSAAATHGFVEFASDIASIPTGSAADYYKIVFNTDGGSVINDIYKTDGVDITLPLNIPIKEMYIFDEWNTAADGTGTSYAPGDTFNVDSDTTLYAQYTDITTLYTIGTTISNGGTAATILDLSAIPRTTDTAIDIKITRNSGDNERDFMGCGRNIGGTWYNAYKDCVSWRCSIYNNNFEYNPEYGETSVWNAGQITSGSTHEYTLGWTYYVRDGSTVTRTEPPVHIGYFTDAMGIFAAWDIATSSFKRMGNFSFEYLDIYDDDGNGNVSYHRKYRPATRISDSATGLLDILTGDFASSTVTGQSFIVS